MRYLMLFTFFLFISVALEGQDLDKGVISYITSKNIYVKFESTQNIEPGDTLYLNKNGELVPALLVNNKSSISCVCTPLIPDTFKTSDEIFAKGKKEIKEAPVEETITEQPAEGKPGKKERVKPPKAEKEDVKPFKQKIRGRISAASYSNLSSLKNTHRLRYGFRFQGNHLGNTGLSVNSYVTFRHTIDEWYRVEESLGSALKIYSLALKYDFNKTTNITLGRKINPKISSMGAIDGLQFETGAGNFIFGALAGSRPDFSDYGLNIDLLQAGGYVGYVSNKDNNYHQTTIGFIEQRNKANTDRRFVYFQHSNSLFKNLNMFTSMEVDLYEKVNGVSANSVNLTNLYVSLRYRFSKKFRVSASYDARNNIIYYESFASFIDQLIEQETRQGLRFGVNYKPVKNLGIGVNASWRFQTSGANDAKNLSGYVTVNRIPGVNMRATVTANFLETNYISSRIFGLRLYKDMLKGKINGGFHFRRVDYQYKNSETKTNQNIAGMNFSFRIMKKLSLYLYYEGTLDGQDRFFHRLNSKIIKRF